MFAISNPWKIICFFVWFGKEKISISLKVIITILSHLSEHSIQHLRLWFSYVFVSWTQQKWIKLFFLFFFWKALNKLNRAINRWKIDIIAMLINLFLSINDRRKIIKECWKLFFLSSLIHNLTAMFLKWCWNESVRNFLFWGEI